MFSVYRIVSPYAAGGTFHFHFPLSRTATTVDLVVVATSALYVPPSRCLIGMGFMYHTHIVYEVPSR
jgi:hypothetical protein